MAFRLQAEYYIDYTCRLKAELRTIVTFLWQ